MRMGEARDTRYTMDDTTTDPSGPLPSKRKPDVYHVYVQHEDVSYFLAPDGTFVPELEKGRAFHDIQDAFDVVNQITEGRNLSRRDEPGVMVNAWKWVALEA